MPVDIAERWRTRVAGAFERLDAALTASKLPEEPATIGEVDAWLLNLRRRSLCG
jgi:uncharacterized protein